MKFSELKKISDDLLRCKPHFAVSAEREKLLLQIDAIYGEICSEFAPALGKFYNMQVDRMIDEIETYPGITLRMWKFYSSGFIIKDANRTVAHDINNGCELFHGRSSIRLKPSRINKLADLIDEYYNTHSHADHISSELCDALARRKKLLVMPMQAKNIWQIPSATAAEKLDLPHVKTYLNWQGDASGGLDCAMYLFTLANGRTVFVRGDIYHAEGFLGCIDFMDRNNLSADYIFTTYYSTSGPEPIPFMAEKYPACRVIPIHEWEFSHRPAGKSGPATQCFAELMQVHEFLYRQNRAQYLTWGESIDLD